MHDLSHRDMGGSQRFLREAIDRLDGDAAQPARHASRPGSASGPRHAPVRRGGPWIIAVVLAATALLLGVGLLAA